MSRSRFKHHFLLAMPSLTQSYFGDSILYVCEHSEEGALGLMINRTLSEVTLGELFNQLEIDGTAHRDVPVLEGGPVQRDRGFVLHSDDLLLESTLRLEDNLALTTAREMLAAIAADTGPERFLVCVGYAGWGAGQLESEMAENSWLTAPASSDILFDAPYAERVSRAAAALGIDFRLISGEAGHG